MADVMDMPDIDAAMARLDDAERQESNHDAAPAPAEVETPAEQPAEPVAPTTETPASNPTDTPAAPETEPSTETPKNEPAKPAENKSKFAKDQERRVGTWKEINVEKDALKKQKATLDEQRNLFQREQEQFKLERAKQTTKFTPEQYEQASQQKLGLAQQHDLTADGLEARAEKAEADGKYQDANRLKQQARNHRNASVIEQNKAREMKDYAAHMRQNPDPTAQQVQARNSQQMRDYTLKAAEQWPEVAKEGSEFQKTMAGHLKEAAAQGMRAEDFPVIMYHAARLTAAESAAARVPGMEKELGALRAKVKELEALTAPGGGNAAPSSLPGKRARTDDEEFAELRSMALNV